MTGGRNRFEACGRLARRPRFSRDGERCLLDLEVAGRGELSAPVVIPVSLTVLCRDECAERARVLCGDESVSIVGHLETVLERGSTKQRIQPVVDELYEVLEFETPVPLIGDDSIAPG